MGYTHYWKHKADLPEDKWGGFMMWAKEILEHEAAAPTCTEFDEPFGFPQITRNLVRFNGVLVDGHDTFLFCRQDKERQFCKTSGKPYDQVVTAILILAHEWFGDLIEITSDGHWSDWRRGIDLFEAATGRTALPPSGMKGDQA